MCLRVRNYNSHIGFEPDLVPYRLRYSDFRKWAATLFVLSVVAAFYDGSDAWQAIASGEAPPYLFRNIVEVLGILGSLVFARVTTEIHFTPNRMLWHRHAFLSNEERELSYREFKGLRHRVEVREHNSGDGVVTETHQTIDLIHEDPEMVVRLCSKEDDKWNDREKLENYAQFFDLPIIEEEGGKKHRAKEIIGKTISASKSEGASASALGTTTSTEALSHPPASISISSASDSTAPEIQIKLKFAGRLTFETLKYPSLFLISIVFSFYLGEEANALSTILVLVFLVCIFFIPRHLVRYFRALHWPNQLHLIPGPSGHIKLVWGSTSHDRDNVYYLKNCDIEEIALAKVPERFGLIVHSTDKKMVIRTAMKKRDLEWLRDFLISKL